MYRAWTDGAYSPRRNCGGWAFIIVPPLPLRCVEMRCHVCNTTSQRMELEALRVALTSVPEGAEIEVITDSEYAVHGFNRDWLLQANLDLWERIWELGDARVVTMTFSPRCSIPEQIEVDHLAKLAVEEGGLTNHPE